MSIARPTFKTSLAALALLIGAASAQAAIVNPGQTLPLSGTSAAERPELVGDVIADESFNFSLVATPGSSTMITGTVQQLVVREAATGTLDFYWRIT